MFVVAVLLANGCALPVHTDVDDEPSQAHERASLPANVVLVPWTAIDDAVVPGVGESLELAVARKSFEAVVASLIDARLFGGGVLTSTEAVPRDVSLRAAMVEIAQNEKADYSALLEVRYGPVEVDRNLLLPLSWVPGVVVWAHAWAPVYTVRSDVSLTVRFFSRLEARQTHTVTVTDRVHTLVHDLLTAEDHIVDRTIRHAVPQLLDEVLSRPQLFASHRDRSRVGRAASRICLGSFGVVGGDLGSRRLTSIERAFPALLRGSLVQRGYTLAARRDLDEVLSELRIQRTEMFDLDKLGQIGKLAGAELVITGTLVEVDDAVRLEIVGYDIETGLSAIAGSARIGASDDLKTIADDLAARLAVSAPAERLATVASND